MNYKEQHVFLLEKHINYVKIYLVYCNNTEDKIFVFFSKMK